MTAFEFDALEFARAQCIQIGEIGDEAAQLAERLGQDHLAATLRDVAARARDDRFVVMVAGEFNAGKTTVINSLLGEPILPMRATEATAILTEVRYGDEATVELHPAEDGPHAGTEPRTIPAEQFASMSDELLVDNFDNEYKSPWERAVVSYPIDLCRNGVVIVDSPGLNKRPERQAITLAGFATADAVVFVFSALANATMTEVAIIDDYLDTKEPFWLVNRRDQLSPGAEPQVRAALEYALRECRPDDQTIASRVFFTDAQSALDAAAAGDRHAFEASGMGVVARTLTDYLGRDRHRQKATGSIQETVKLLTALQRSTADQVTLLGQEHDELARRYRDAQAPLAELEAAARVATMTLRNDLAQISADLFDQTVAKVRGLPEEASLRSGVTTTSRLAGLLSSKAKREASEKRVIDEVQAAVTHRVTSHLKAWFTEQVEPVVDERAVVAVERCAASLRSAVVELEAIRSEILGVAATDVDVALQVSGLRIDVSKIQVDRAGRLSKNALQAAAGALLVFVPMVGPFLSMMTFANLGGGRQELHDAFVRGCVDELLRGIAGQALDVAQQVQAGADAQFGELCGRVDDEFARTVTQLRETVAAALAATAEDEERLRQRRAELGAAQERITQLTADLSDLQAILATR